jgi:hypothetical protein
MGSYQVSGKWGVWIVVGEKGLSRIVGDHHRHYVQKVEGHIRDGESPDYGGMEEVLSYTTIKNLSTSARTFILHLLF